MIEESASGSASKIARRWFWPSADLPDSYRSSLRKACHMIHHNISRNFVAKFKRKHIEAARGFGVPAGSRAPDTVDRAWKGRFYQAEEVELYFPRPISR